MSDLKGGQLKVYKSLPQGCRSILVGQLAQHPLHYSIVCFSGFWQECCAPLECMWHVRNLVQLNLDFGVSGLRSRSLKYQCICARRRNSHESSFTVCKAITLTRNLPPWSMTSNVWTRIKRWEASLTIILASISVWEENIRGCLCW